MNFLYNENSKNKIKATKANGKYIYIENKKLLDLSYASGSLLLGHTSLACHVRVPSTRKSHGPQGQASGSSHAHSAPCLYLAQTPLGSTSRDRFHA